MGANGDGPGVVQVIVIANTIMITKRLQIAHIGKRYNKMPKLNLNMVIVFHFASLWV
jgi:hypothetical protein